LVEVLVQMRAEMMRLDLSTQIVRIKELRCEIIARGQIVVVVGRG
jgi:hypothetical protein